MTYLNFTFQDSSPLIHYSDGEWTEGSASNDSFIEFYSDETFHVTTVNDANYTLTFTGSSITIYGAKRLNHGNYSVSLDDGPLFVGDGNGHGQKIFQFPLWNAQNLPYEQHTVAVRNIVTGPLGFPLDVDFISIGREIGPPGYTGPIYNMTLDDVSPFVSYSRSWKLTSPANTSMAFGGTLHSTTEEGASLSLSFQGSSIELYGLYNNAPIKVSLDDNFPFNLAGPNVDLDVQQEHPQTLLFYADGLDESQTHNITMTNSVSNLGRPLQFDYAIVRGSQRFFNDTPQPTTASTPSSQTTLPTGIPIPGAPRSRHPVGDLVGYVIGGIGGLIILLFFGIILRRRRSSLCLRMKLIQKNPGEIPTGGVSAISPTAHIYPGSTIRKTCSPQVPTLPTMAMGISLSSQDHSVETTVPRLAVEVAGPSTQPERIISHDFSNWSADLSVSGSSPPPYDDESCPAG